MIEQYLAFTEGYIQLCKATGYYFDVTEGGFLGIFRVAANKEDFEQQTKDIGGGE